MAILTTWLQSNVLAFQNWRLHRLLFFERSRHERRQNVQTRSSSFITQLVWFHP